MATFDEMQKEYTAQTDRAAAINQQYDAQKNAQLAQLRATYDQQMSAKKDAANKIDPAYQQKANDLAVQHERNRRNFNQQASVSGINTGTFSQAQLAMNSAYLRDYGALRTSQAEQQAEAQRGMADLEVGYQNQVQQALAQNDYERAAALTAEYKDKYNRDLAQAQTLAKYGDFSAYAALYGADRASNMASTWTSSNPDLAYNLGRIDAQEYFRMTGKYPEGSEEGQAALAAEQQKAAQEEAEQKAMQQAQLLAKYGDFSGYGSIYGQEAADAMSRAWNASNPELAYNTGRITAQDYYGMTGKYPVGSQEAQVFAAAQQALGAQSAQSSQNPATGPANEPRGLSARDRQLMREVKDLNQYQGNLDSLLDEVINSQFYKSLDAKGKQKVANNFSAEYKRRDAAGSVGTSEQKQPIERPTKATASGRKGANGVSKNRKELVK